MTERHAGGEGSPEKQPQGAAGESEPGVMGALPRSRPTIRSPRRDAAAARRARSASATSEPAERGGDQPGIEDLARAGASVAAGAATLGLRIAGRAASAVREALERR
jgi:hypothetical protein